MFDLGWTEMLLIGIVALIVVGPKDLPGLFRTVGQFVGKAKGMAREFSTAMNAAADESGIKEINKTIKAAANPQKFGADKLRDAATGSAKSALKPGGDVEGVKSTLSEERAANKEKIDKAMAKAAQDRVAAESAAREAAPTTETPPKPGAPEPDAPKQAAPKKAASKKAPSKKAPPKDGQAKTRAVKKPVPKTASAKAAPKKSAPRKAAPKKPAPKSAAEDAK